MEYFFKSQAYMHRSPGHQGGGEALLCSAGLWFSLLSSPFDAENRDVLSCCEQLLKNWASPGKIKKLHSLYGLVELCGIPAQRMAEPQWNSKHGASSMEHFRIPRKESGTRKRVEGISKFRGRNLELGNNLRLSATGGLICVQKRISYTIKLNRTQIFADTRRY